MSTRPEGDDITRETPSLQQQCLWRIVVLDVVLSSCSCSCVWSSEEIFSPKHERPWVRSARHRHHLHHHHRHRHRTECASFSAADVICNIAISISMAITIATAFARHYDRGSANV